MDIDNFSCASQWAPMARETMRRKQHLNKKQHANKGEGEGRWGVTGSLKNLITW